MRLLVLSSELPPAGYGSATALGEFLVAVEHHTDWRVHVVTRRADGSTAPPPALPQSVRGHRSVPRAREWTSRNPMYTGFAIAYLGGGLLPASWWPLSTLPVVLVTVYVLVIEPEERYLADRFGTDYRCYCRDLRRWL